MPSSAPASSSFRLLRKNLTLLGAPGSGKGFYGQPLAQAWGVPLWTASSILRASQQALDALDSGRLVDCNIVSQALLRHLEQQQEHANEGQQQGSSSASAFVMDGFPRTRQQIQLMVSQWPPHLQITHAVLLDVPEAVCLTKIKGRRHCTKCQRSFNTMGYHQDGFDLPPMMPSRIPCPEYSHDCDPGRYWEQRADDACDDIIRARQQTHREHEQPIIDYFEQQGRLLRYTPYHGAKDLNDMRGTIEAWLSSSS